MTNKVLTHTKTPFWCIAECAGGTFWIGGHCTEPRTAGECCAITAANAKAVGPFASGTLLSKRHLRNSEGQPKGLNEIRTLATAPSCRYSTLLIAAGSTQPVPGRRHHDELVRTRRRATG